MGPDVTPERRMVVALLLSAAIYLGWSYVALQRRRALPPAAAAVSTEVAKPPVPPSLPVPTPLTPEAAEELIELDTPELHVVLSSKGATLVHAQLKAPKYQRRVEGKDEPVDLARETIEGHRPLETKFGGGLAALPPDASYAVARDADGLGARFTRKEGAATIEKHFHLVAPYLAELEVRVEGLAAENLTISYPSGQPPGSVQSSGFFGIGRTVPNVATGLCRVDGSNQRGQGGRAGDIKVQKENLPKDGRAGQISFIGLDERFFVGAFYPAGSERLGHCTVESLSTGTVSAAMELPLSTGTGLRFGVYLGPKDFDRLRGAGVLPGGTAPTAELQSTVDFGFWTALCVPMLLAMEFFHRFVANWGLVIIVLTVAIKLVLLPLQQRYFKSMEVMKKLQPQVEELKKKHATDKERLNLETMKLYSENNANPFGSCLPMLLQLPIWFALYRLLGMTIQLYREPFIPGWINDLTAPDPFYILPLGMGATMIVTQLLTPQTMEGAQQKFLMWFMPVFFTFTFLKVPAGLSLYIFASNLLNIGQQYVLTRRFRKPPGNPPR